jgi:hypothetical protein
MTDKFSPNKLYVKCIEGTSFDSDPAKPWFAQPFVNYPDASKYSEARFQDTFIQLYVLQHPPYTGITSDVDTMIDNIKYFKRNLTPTATVPALPFLQRGVFLAGDDLVRSAVPGIFEKMYAENSANEDEEDFFLPFSGKKVDERKMGHICTLSLDGVMLHSDGFDVSPELRKQITRDGFANIGNFWDVRLPSRFIATAFEDKEWNRVKGVSSDKMEPAHIEGYFLIDPDTGKKLVRFNPIVFSMAFRVPYIMDSLLERKQIEEPNKTVLLNTTVLYEIMHGAVLSQMGNYAMDMHYNLLMKMIADDVGYLKFRNALLKHSASVSDKTNTAFWGVPLLEFKNKVFAYQQFFNLVLFYLMYATTANTELRQYARPYDPELDFIFEFMAMFTTEFVHQKDINEKDVDKISAKLNDLLGKYNKRHSDDVDMSSGLAFLVGMYSSLSVIEKSQALRIYASYVIDDKIYVISNQDILNFINVIGTYYMFVSTIVEDSEKEKVVKNNEVIKLYDEMKSDGMLTYLEEMHNLIRVIQTHIASTNLASIPRDYRRQLKLLTIYERKLNEPFYYYPGKYDKDNKVVSFEIVSKSGQLVSRSSDNAGTYDNFQKVLKALSDYEWEIESNPINDVRLIILLNKRDELRNEMVRYNASSYVAASINFLKTVQEAVNGLKKNAVKNEEYVYGATPKLDSRKAAYDAMKSLVSTLISEKKLAIIQKVT